MTLVCCLCEAFFFRFVSFRSVCTLLSLCRCLLIYLFTYSSPQRTSWLLNWAFLARRLCNKGCLIPPAVKREVSSFWELHCEPFDYLPQLKPAALKKCECAVANGAPLLCFAESFSFFFFSFPFFFFWYKCTSKKCRDSQKNSSHLYGKPKQPSGKLAIFPLGVNSKKKINIYEKQ